MRFNAIDDVFTTVFYSIFILHFYDKNHLEAPNHHVISLDLFYFEI